MRDFTMEKYEGLCRSLLNSGYHVLTVSQSISNKLRDRSAVIRHDVDRKIDNALKMAELEHELGIHSTYYFRYPYTFKPDVIKRIESLGNEIGYHYEVLAKVKGDQNKAITVFSQELAAFRTISEVRTISMHGSPLSRYDNRDLWIKNDFRDYGIEGEAYLSLASKGLRYLSDTGRDWGGRYSIKDKMPQTIAVPIHTTDELITWINSTNDNLYINVHPERWANSEMERVVSSIKDGIMNIGKMSVSKALNLIK